MAIGEQPPLCENELWNLLSAASGRMTTPQRRLWEVVRIVPTKWRQHPCGDCCGGFWAVAVIGEFVIWYNEIEEGFNLSRYSRHGLIDEYRCNQDQSEWTLEHVLRMMKEDAPSSPGKEQSEPL